MLTTVVINHVTLDEQEHLVLLDCLLEMFVFNSQLIAKQSVNSQGTKILSLQRDLLWDFIRALDDEFDLPLTDTTDNTDNSCIMKINDTVVRKPYTEIVRLALTMATIPENGVDVQDKGIKEKLLWLF